MMQMWIGLLAAFLAAVLCGKWLIPILIQLKFGQEIREEGPKWHEKKSGTPTMGGFIFIAGIFIGLAVAILVGLLWKEAQLNWMSLGMLSVMAVAFGAIGFLDDYIKVILKRNLGLTARQKFGLQCLAALAFVCWAVLSGGVETAISVPFINWRWEMSWGFIPFAVLVILATVNSVNLTDGLDGLATCVTAVVALFFAVFAKGMENQTVALFASVTVGGLLGFLVYNKFPAKVFMGDTGSLCLGGIVCGLAVLLGEPLMLLLVGLVYVLESLSVILQVASFKLTGKRIFKMSPLHHHFEMCGWHEKKIVAVFTLVTALICILVYIWG